MRILSFALASFLQSWGEDSPWGYKKTELMPTKAGIVGLISCCFGYRYGDPRIKQLNDEIRIAIRADKPGHVIEDFSVVNSNLDYMVTASGIKRKNEGKDITKIIIRKYYLQDARFQVYIQAEESLLQDIYSAMRSPKWLVSLGRKNCVPTEPVIPVWIDAEDLHEAVTLFTPEQKKRVGNRVKVEMDSVGLEKATLLQSVYTRMDNIKNASTREFGTRRVCSYYIDS